MRGYVIALSPEEGAADFSFARCQRFLRDWYLVFARATFVAVKLEKWTNGSWVDNNSGVAFGTTVCDKLQG